MRSVLGDLLATAEASRRVPQPFSSKRLWCSDPAARQQGSDLAADLQAAITGPAQGPKVRIICGNAGSGKSVAFNALVASLYRDFIEAKRSRQLRRRPIVFLPSHLRSASAGYVDDVIAAVKHTDAAEAVPAEQFRWLLMNGHAVWMFDGLDEFYAGSGDFFTFIEEALSEPGSEAQFIIGTRDSLMSSNAALKSFVERRLAQGNDVEVYELAPWTANAWRKKAALEIEARKGVEVSQEQAERFVWELENSTHLSALAQLPFYCSVLLESFLKHGSLPEDEFEAVESLINSMVDREQGKNIFRWQDFVDIERLSEFVEQETERQGLCRAQGHNLHEFVQNLLTCEGRNILLDLIGAVALETWRTAEGKDTPASMPVAGIRELPGLATLPFGLNSEVVHRLRTVIVQFAFFGPGRKAGCVDFAHPILRDYLAARYAVATLKSALCENDALLKPKRADGTGNNGTARMICEVLDAYAHRPHSMFCRYIAREAGRDPTLSNCLPLSRPHPALQVSLNPVSIVTSLN